ncbi:hypothetical protein HanXRQr2_Chr04g0168641 [Helianthus annuus]|uniref:Uncharacterized protein n=1 Tax=Helianthus annuus TaxID=4232 RepID=A0A9K3J8U6_HELAN|nr:hypothetical protein HanXRQr2_Chr04g0168641 [Helianthus annuus]KAJ0931488.1 hypothetical protein HanPSC8_Chr04g0162221 [Helianthus annuus]
MNHPKTIENSKIGELCTHVEVQSILNLENSISSIKPRKLKQHLVIESLVKQKTPKSEDRKE